MEIKVGDRFKNTRGSEYLVIDYKNYENITVEFCDEHKYTVTKGGTCVKSGNIKNPYHPLLFGIGYYGVGSHKSKLGSTNKGFGRLPAYSAWVNMLSRCYDSNYITPYLYDDVYVDNSWHNYQVFAEWYTDQLRNNKFDGKLCLDKDILSDEFVYSASTCCLIPDVINILVKSSKGGKYMQGVGSSKRGFYVIPGDLVPDILYKTEVEAHLAYVEAKSNKIRRVAIEYKDYLIPKVFSALMTRDFRYKFSPLFKPEPKSTFT